MPRLSPIPVSELLLDQKNARLGEEQESQQATIHALATQQGRRLVKLAESIVERGLDIAQPFTVVATGDKKRGYTVLEGNRRTLALKALETPTIVQSALSPADFKKLLTLSARFADAPIEEVNCALYEPHEQEQAIAFVISRHGGAQDGAGLVEWDSDEKDRFLVRHGASTVRAYSGQVIDFLKEIDGASDSKTRIITTLQRLLKSKAVQAKLGIEAVDGELVSRYPIDEVAKGLRKIVGDLRSQNIKVPDVYHEEQRKTYINKFSADDLPDPATKLDAPARLADLPKGQTTTVTPKPKPTRSKTKPKPPRTTVAASDAKINPTPARLNSIYNELVTMNADQFPNGASVLFRVFVELSVDDYIGRHQLMTEDVRRNTPLAKRMKTVNDHLYDANAIPKGLHTAVEQVANTQHGLAAGVVTMNQYVHNGYAFPKPSEIRTSWDELQPFLEAIWK